MSALSRDATAGGAHEARFRAVALRKVQPGFRIPCEGWFAIARDSLTARPAQGSYLLNSAILSAIVAVPANAAPDAGFRRSMTLIVYTKSNLMASEHWP